jgi:probable F420-dependent oxidoreductase
LRFAVTAPPITTSISEWGAALRRIEDSGIDTVVMADHFTDAYDTEPMVSLTAAAMLTTSLRVQTGVLGNDYRHPVLTHRMAATLDVLSGGRFVLGIGAGWMTSDYEAAGIPLDPPGVRVSRLTEAITVIKGLFGAEPFSFDGEHYQIHALDGLPKPVHPPHPPFFIGGGSPRVLRLAGREADIVGINASLVAGELGRHAVVDFARERVVEKLGWVHEGATKAGRDPAALEYAMNHWLVRLTDSADEAHEFLGRIGARFDVTAAELEDSPAVLVGTLEHCVARLQRERDELGINIIQLDAGFAPRDYEPLFPLVAAAAGT